MLAGNGSPFSAAKSENSNRICCTGVPDHSTN
jgi:hypothetical protein